MKLTLSRKTTYIPEWNGNRDLPEDQQIKVRYRYLTTEERNDFIAYAGDRSIASIAKDIFKSQVDSIENLEIEIEKETVENPTPDQLLGMPDLYPLFSEVSSEIISASAITEKTKKKSRRSIT